MHVQATTAVRGAAATRPPAWGVHLPLDVAACRLGGATDERAIREFVSDVVEAIGMRAHGEPLVAHFAEHAPEAASWSIVELIEDVEHRPRERARRGAVLAAHH